MAAIASISNGEAMSSVRTKLNSVITEINLLDPTDWVDYSATSTIVGWSSFTTKLIRYRIIGKQLFFQVLINGTSNSTSATFTLPFNVTNIGSSGVYRLTNNGALGNGIYDFTIGSSICTCYSSVTASSWTASGTKLIYFQGFIEIA